MTLSHLSRRQVLAACGTSAGITGLSTLTGQSTSAAAPVNGSWPLGRGDSANTGYTDARGPTNSVSVRWTFDEHLVARKPPVIKDGYLYVGTFEDTAAFVALDAATSKERWRTDLGDGMDVRFNGSAAAIAGDVVLAGFGEVLFAFDTETGKERWRRSFSDSEIRAPVVAEGIVYVVVGGTGTVYAIDPASGDVQWETKIGEWAPGAAAVVDGTVYASGNHGQTAGFVVALDAGTGDKQWHHRTNHRLTTPPAVTDESLYIGEGSGLLSLATTDGTQRWRFQPQSGSTGEAVDWGYLGSAPAVHDDTVYVGAPDERVYALDATSGEQRWAFWTWNDVTGDPVVAGDTVYVGSDDSFIYAFDAASGTRRWEFDTTGRIDGAGGAVVDGILYVSTWEDGLYALEEK
ncbi:PQQ-binding-like beta-propeller repeat protein [Halomicrococcus sp. NG-SE-24]|uniref:outer membrane protein assembly factor BamB family protein n=1 Tax=Halomicrococcus sp. NG-SE-24 TaxID=3436928 RepID=UPI003D96AB15